MIKEINSIEITDGVEYDIAKYIEVKSDGTEEIVGTIKYNRGSEETTIDPKELRRATFLLNQAEILANQRQQDKVMAAILLEQVGGEVNV